MLADWQTLPLKIDPILFTFAGVPFPWYTACYLVGIMLAVLFFVSLARRQNLLPNDEITIELMVSVLWGVIIGARLGFVFLYGDERFLQEPWRIVSPYDFTTGEWTGIRGLSFHGGLIGGAFGLFRFVRETKRRFWNFSDALVQAVPIGLFFGRLGNFLNHELLGRPTEAAWGMYFIRDDSALRHPVTLYEAAGEGIVLFFLLALAARLYPRPGFVSAFFLMSYGAIRYGLEFFRDDSLLPTLFLTTGQVASLLMLFLGVCLFFFMGRKPVIQ